MFSKIFFKLIGLISWMGVGVAHGATSSAASSNCPPGQHWVHSHPRSAYTRSDGTFVSATQVRAHCQGNPPSYEVWNPRLKSGVPPKWQNKSEKARAWTEDEKERVLEALSVLPDALLTKSVDGIYRFEKYGKEPANNPGSGFENNIVLYDEAFKSKQNLSRVLAHEFAHKLYSQFHDTDRGKEYADIAEWKAYPDSTNGGTFLATWRDKFVEDDGADGPGEDFSNNIDYFLFDPKKLKSISPKIYDWIQKKYGAKFKVGKVSK